MTCSKPFRLLHLPSLAHDVIFSLMAIGDLYHLSKCSTRSRYVVKTFTRCQTYSFKIDADMSRYRLRIWCDDGKKTFHHVLRPMDYRTAVDGRKLVTYCEDYWATTKEEILYLLDVFTREVNYLHFDDATKVIETTEFLKRATHSPVECVYLFDEEPTIDDEVYKYILKEFKNTKKLKISACPSSGFRFDEMEPFTGNSIGIDIADWMTVDHLVRCFPNAEKMCLYMDAKRCLITPQLMPQFFNAWRHGSRMRDLELECDWRNTEFQVMFENVPKTVVKRVEVKSKKLAFKEGRCFLIRQEESGVEAIAYRCYDMLYFTTDFRLLRDDESDGDNHDSDDDFIDDVPWNSDSDEDF